MVYTSHLKWAVSVACGAILLVASQALAAPRYELTALPDPGFGGKANGITHLQGGGSCTTIAECDVRSVVVGEVNQARGTTQAAMWQCFGSDPSSCSFLSLPEVDDSIVASKATDAHVQDCLDHDHCVRIVGAGTRADGSTAAIVWLVEGNDPGGIDSGFVVTNSYVLPTLGGVSAEASGLWFCDYVDYVVGRAQTASGDFHAVLWTSVRDAGVQSEWFITDLGTLGGSESEANGITMECEDFILDAIVVGEAELPNGDSHAIVWELTSDAAGVWNFPAHVIDLGTLGGAESRANGIQCITTPCTAYEVVGTAQNGAGMFQALVWDTDVTDVDMHVLNIGDFTSGEALAINANGQVVGTATGPLADNWGWTSNPERFGVTLNALLSPRTPRVESATGIGANGTICGYATFPSSLTTTGSISRAVILFPTNEFAMDVIEVTKGLTQSGGLTSLFWLDGEVLDIANSGDVAQVQAVWSGIVNNSGTYRISTTSAVDNVPGGVVFQRIELYNFGTGRWQPVGRTTHVTMAVQTEVFEIKEGGLNSSSHKFISDSGEVRARATFQRRGPGGPQKWDALLDEISLRVE